MDPLGLCLIRASGLLDRPMSRAAVDAVRRDARASLSLEEAVTAAGNAGIVAAPGPLSIARIDTSHLPAIAFLKGGRVVVLEARGPNGTFRIWDPATEQAQDWAAQELDQHYDGHLLLMRATETFAETDSAGQLQTGHWFRGPLWSNRWTYVQVAIAALATNVLGLVSSIFIMVVYDRILPNEAISSLIALAGGVALALLFDLAIRSLRALFIDHAGRRADRTIGRRVFDQLLNMRLSERKGASGDLVATLREFDSLRDVFTSATLVALVDLPFILLFIWVIWLVAGPLAAVPAIIVPLVIVMGLLLQPALSRLVEKSFRDGQAKQTVLVEAVSGLETIKASGADRAMRARWDAALTRGSDHSLRTRGLTQAAMNVTNFLQQSSQVAIVVWGVFLIAEGSLSMGALIAGVILTGRCLAPLGQIAQTLARLQQARAAYRALDRLMSAPVDRPLSRRYLSRPDLKGSIMFEGVSFTYPGADVPTIENVSFAIAPGERVAILGRSGSGKSTLARLLLGLYEPVSGRVLIDETDTRQIDPAELRAAMGAVLQEAWLFAGSVRDNIAVTRPAADDQEILDAAKLAGAHDFLSQHPRGYDLVLKERGESLSGGQRQMLCLARALLGGPKMLVLDEPTSAMDLQSEAALIARLKPALNGRTSVIITHRPQLLALVGRVIVMERGKIVQDVPRSEWAALRTAVKAPQRSNEELAENASQGSVNV